MMDRSDTNTRGGNDYYPRICKRCGHDKDWCVCRMDYIDFLDEKFEQEQQRLFRENCKSYIHNSNPSIISIRKNLHSLSGMKGIGLLKKRDKR